MKLEWVQTKKIHTPRKRGGGDRLAQDNRSGAERKRGKKAVDEHTRKRRRGTPGAINAPYQGTQKKESTLSTTPTEREVNLFL